MPLSLDRKSTRLNSSHGSISYAVFCLKKKKQHSTKAQIGQHETSPASTSSKQPPVIYRRPSLYTLPTYPPSRPRTTPSVFFFLRKGPPPSFTLFPYPTLSR